MVGTNGSCMAGCIHVLYVHVPYVHYVPYLMHVYSMSFDAGQNPSVRYQVGTRAYHLFQKERERDDDDDDE